MNNARQVLIERLKQARDFLARNVERQSSYSDLVTTLDSISDRLKSPKLIVKIVSPSSSLAKSLQTQHEADLHLRSLFEFETVSPISQLQQILENCDLICLLYDKKHVVREHHYKLIELAQKRGIDLLILVQINKADPHEAYSNWQRDLNARADSLLPLPFKPFIDLDRPEELDLYQRSLIDLATVLENNRWLRIERNLVWEIKSFFNQKITGSWQAIKQINDKYCEGQPLYLYQQQFRQNTQTSNQFRQQLIRDIKQAINHQKTDLLNPFTVDGLIFNFQQLINSAETKIVTEDQTYLYLVLTEFPEQPYLHDYVLELCQQRVDRIIADQWSKICCEYGSGLEQLVRQSERQLNKIQPLLSEPKTIVSDLKQPSFNLERAVDSFCFKIGTRIPFDYNFTQSSWFRLVISALIGTAIYFLTWIFLGTGKYIGFMIIIFQIINLITGQNIKKSKLKQHTKELKRIVDQKCQSLARTAVSYLTQTLIIAVDRECQFYQEKSSETIAIAQSKLDELKQTNEEYKANIENLKRDRDKILTWFD